MYGSIKELTELAKKESVPIWKIILDTEMKITECSEEQVYDKLDKRYEVMYKSVHKALQEPQVITGNLISGSAKKQYEYSEQQDTLGGFLINHIMALALSASEVNASMGKICAAPTAGSCGILPAVIIGVSEHYGLSRKDTLNGLLTASGIGTVVINNATVSGAEGGCQAECGVAAAMDAAAVVQMRGGTPDMIGDVISLTLMNCMGLICDPVAGLVQVPCAQRNASQAVNAITSADMILGGMTIPIPADEVGAVLMVDMAHIAGLVAAGLHPSPIPYADVVTTTTHKTLRGPRGGMILANKEAAEKFNFNKAIFPGIQGGPLMHVIAGKAICLGEALKPEFKAYQEQVVKNAKALSAALIDEGFDILTGGTDNHLMLVDLRNMDISGKELQNRCDEAYITLNKNTVPNDPRSPFVTSGVRIGTPAVTTRGMVESDIKIAQEAVLAPIGEVAAKLDIKEDELECYGKYKAKLSSDIWERVKDNKDGKLILVTAINPTPAGEGKTTISVGLGEAFNRLNKKAVIALREPSLGPCFGIKGGAAGGGYAQVVPMEDLNLHFTGDFHAITSANNLLAALLDNHIQQGNILGIDPERIVWNQ